VDRRGFLALSGTALARPRRLYGGDLGALRRSLRGMLLARGDRGYDAARLVYDTRFDGVRPLAVALCETPADVGATIRFAVRNGIPLRARSGGHSYAGYSTVADGIVVDVSRMSAIATDGTTATVGAGARLGAVYSGLWRHGVAIPAGSCLSVGVGGLALGGGVGFASRKLGTTSDNLLELRLVNAGGAPVVANARTNPDLFWACRGGGGGNFGVATSFRFTVHPVSRVSRFTLQWPWAQARQAVRAWLAFAPQAPDELFSVLSLSTGGGVVSVGQYFGPETSLRRLVAPLASTGAPSVSIVSSSFYEAVLHFAGSTARATFKGKSDYLTRPLPDSGIDAVVEWIERGRAVRGLGSGALLFDSYGGAINRVPSAATAFVHRDSLCSLQYLAYWAQGSASAQRASLGWIDGFYAAMRPHVSGFAYQNYIDPDLPGWQHAYYGTNLKRLALVKRKVDPDGVFHFPQSLRIS
jgi:FAD/FMN-containing dehydrogenase